MHDGQNVFDPATSTHGIPWGMDGIITRLMDSKIMRGAIVAGIWNSEFRQREFMPQKVYESVGFEKQRKPFIESANGEPISDAYLSFIVHELKPFIDSHYPTLSDQQNTFIIGSSRGGVISLYAISEYPDIFHGAGCISTHWSAGEHELVTEMAKALPDPKTHRLYFDYGTQGLDAFYGPYQKQMDECLRKKGYVENKNWLTRKFEGADHNEAAWQARVEIPLSFLLASRNEVESE
jgi:predicted alpha/beta superfamily hydrolase